MQVLISSLIAFATLLGVVSADFAQATPLVSDSCDPPPDQSKPPKK